VWRVVFRASRCVGPLGVKKKECDKRKKNWNGRGRMRGCSNQPFDDGGKRKTLNGIGCPKEIGCHDGVAQGRDTSEQGQIREGEREGVKQSKRRG